MTRRARQRGQAMTEYAIIVFCLVIALFAPWWPDPEGGGRISTFLLFVRTFDIYVNSFHLVITMPVP